MENHEIKTKDSKKLTNEDFQKELKIILDNKDDNKKMPFWYRYIGNIKER